MEPLPPRRQPERFDQVVADYLKAREAGRADDLDALLARHPDLAEEVAAYCARPEAAAGPAGPHLQAAQVADASSSRPGTTTAFDQIVSLCEEFTADWKSATPPPLDAYLRRVGADARPTLLRNLLAIEIDRRRSTGDRPSVGEYLERLPEFAALVREAFVQQSTGPEVHTRHPTPSGPAVKVPVASRLGGYQLLRELGRGGMGVVYEAIHLQRGHHVALKTLPTVDGKALHRFKREFRTLADVNHPILVGLHTLEADGCHWYFTMDLLEGVPFLAHVRPGRALDEARLRAALAQLVVGVMALHGRHVVHRDLKPSNVLVTTTGRVVLLDFGLVLELSESGGAAGEVAGTPKYMAPEQAAGQAVTPACDWYAVGVMLHEALAGQAPFTGAAQKVLHDKQHGDPPSLIGRPGIPDDLASLCLRLLARDPRQRPDALQITRAIAAQGGTGQPLVVSGSQLVGRTAQSVALQDAYHATLTRPEPLAAFISGRSGEGKTSLAESFLQSLRRDPRTVVLSGRCYDRESVPFKALDNLVDALAAFLRSLPAEESARLVPADVSVLGQVFPVLQEVAAVAGAPPVRLASLDEQQVRQRAFTALRELLRRLRARSPLVLFIDDLQWGDADSAAALFEVLRPPAAPAILFLGSYRSDEAEGSPFLRQWDELQRVHDVQLARRDVSVGPLTAEEATALVVGLLGRDSDVIRRRAAQMAAETGGNPFLLIELVGCFDPDADSFQPMEMHEVLARKLGRLPADAKRLLDVVAVSGQALSLEEAARTAGHDLPPVATLTKMRNERVVRLIGAEERPLVDTYHDRVRETVLGQLDEAARKGLHRSLARVIEGAVGGLPAERVAALERRERGADDEKPLPRVFDLAYHFDAAGERRSAWIYGLLAGEQARRQYALEVAARQFELAQRNAGESPRAVQFRVAEGYAGTLMLLGDYERASEQADRAFGLADDLLDRARVETLQGEIAIKQCRIQKGRELHEQTLRRLGVWVPKTGLGLAVALVREVLVQCRHSLFPGRLAAVRSSGGDRPDRGAADETAELTVRVFNRVIYAYWFQTTGRTLWAHLAGMNRGERLPPSYALAFNYMMHSVMLTPLGWFSRGMRYHQQGVELGTRWDDLLLQASSLFFKGLNLYASARYEAAIESLRQSLPLYEKAGDKMEHYIAPFHISLAHFRLGNLKPAVEIARETFRIGVRRGDDALAHYCIDAWSQASTGNLPFDELRGCFRSIPQDIQSTCEVFQAEGRWHLFHGRTAEAVAACERAYSLAKSNFLVNWLTITSLPLLASALRRHADRLAATDPGQCYRLRRRGLRLARWAARITRFLPTDHPYALRELSLVYAALGRTRKALDAADRSLAAAERQNAKYEHAQTLLVRGRLAHELGRPEAEQQIRTAERALEEIETPIREGAVGR